MIIKMVTEFKLTVFHFARPKRMRVDLPLDKKTVENQDWATGPPGHRAAGPSGRGAVAGLLLAKPLPKPSFARALYPRDGGRDVME